MAIPGYGMGTLNEFVGRELGVSSWQLVDQPRIDAFAACTGDHQWIHVDVERAQREGPFGGTIAHGFLTLSMIAPMQDEIGVIPGDAGQAINYGLNKLRFVTPVKAGARVRLRAHLASVEDRGKGRQLLTCQYVMEIEDEDGPALNVEPLIMVW